MLKWQALTRRSCRRLLLRVNIGWPSLTAVCITDTTCYYRLWICPQSLLHKAGIGQLPAGSCGCLLPPLAALTGSPWPRSWPGWWAAGSGFCGELGQWCELPLLCGFGSTWLHQRATWHRRKAGSPAPSITAENANDSPLARGTSDINIILKWYILV